MECTQSLSFSVTDSALEGAEHHGADAHGFGVSIGSLAFECVFSGAKINKNSEAMEPL